MSAYPACKCELCQVGIKSIAEQYAYHYACYHTAKTVLNYLEQAGIKFSYSAMTDETNPPLNELGCVMDDMCASGMYLQEIEDKHPEFRNWIEKEQNVSNTRKE